MMNSIFSIPNLLIAVPIIVMVFSGGVFLWQYRFRSRNMLQSDQSTVWLLEGLLIIAVVSMVALLVTILR